MTARRPAAPTARPAPRVGPLSKEVRQAAILELVGSRAVRTQDELVGLLAGRRLDVTQATVSRDIRELGLLRVADPDGSRYVSTAPEGAALGRSGSRLERVVRDHAVAVEAVEHTLVVRSRPSTAPLVAAALDAARLDDVAGTVAGDDTVVAVCRSHAAAARVERRLRDLMAGRHGQSPRGAAPPAGVA